MHYVALRRLRPYVRRFVLTFASLGLETSLRDALYAHLQRLPGLPRRLAVRPAPLPGHVDIAAVRRFVGFGLVFLVVNSATFAVVVALLVQLSPILAAVTATGLVPVAVLSGRFYHGYLDVSRRVQDQTGDLTTLVEESATGIRILKAFGAGPRSSSATGTPPLICGPANCSGSTFWEGSSPTSISSPSSPWRAGRASPRSAPPEGSDDEHRRPLEGRRRRR